MRTAWITAAIFSGTLVFTAYCNRGGDHDRKKKSTNTSDDADAKKDEKADDEPEKYNMVVFGDSISAAMLAPSNLGVALNETVLRNLLMLFTDSDDLAKFLDGTKTVALSEIESRLTWHSSLGAFDGLKEWSHRKRLQTMGKNVAAFNLAVSGARIDDAGGQLDTLKAKYDSGTEQARYVVFEFGANDYCQGTPTDEFTAAFSKRLSSLLDMHSKAVVMVASIPNVPLLFQIADDAATAVSFAGTELESALGTSAFTCGKLRAAFHSCPSIQATDKVQKLADMNAAIKTVVDSLQGKNENKLVFGDGIATAALTAEHVAADCFHPSELGQKMIADVTWEAVKAEIK